MKTDEIVGVIESEQNSDKCFKFYLDSDALLIGMFVKGPDYEPLKKSNMWRFVPVADIPEWHKTNALKLTELINGKLIVQILPIR